MDPNTYNSLVFDGLLIQNGEVTNQSTMPIPMYPFIWLNSKSPIKKRMDGKMVSTKLKKDPIFIRIFMDLLVDF